MITDLFTFPDHYSWVNLQQQLPRTAPPVLTPAGGLTWQKLCPQGVETGSVNRSRQMEQVSSCSVNSSADSAIVLLLEEDTEEAGFRIRRFNICNLSERHRPATQMF